jgi:hypothetical protein
MTPGMKRDGERNIMMVSLSPRRNDSPESFNLTRKIKKKHSVRDMAVTNHDHLFWNFIQILIFSFLEILFLFLISMRKIVSEIFEFLFLAGNLNFFGCDFFSPLSPSKKKKTPNKISLNRLDRFSPAGSLLGEKELSFTRRKIAQQLSTSILSGSREPRSIACVLQMVTPNRFSSGQQPHRVYLPSLSLPF